MKLNLIEQGHWEVWDGKQSSMTIFTKKKDKAKYKELNKSTGLPKKKKKK